MTTDGMGRLSSMELASFDPFRGSQRHGKEISTPDLANRIGRRCGPWPRVLQVLVVVQNRAEKNGLARLIGQCGHQAYAVDDGEAALRTAATTRVDVVLLKLEKPELDIFQLATALRLQRNSRDCLILAIGERTDWERRQKCREAGIDVLLRDSVEPSVVETLLLLECLYVNRQRAPRS